MVAAVDKTAETRCFYAPGNWAGSGREPSTRDYYLELHFPRPQLVVESKLNATLVVLS
jgi:hypothetical protein